MKRTLLVLLLLFALSVSAAAFGPDDLTIPASAEAVVYGTSGAGRDLTAYRFGDGKNVMVLTFCIHGYEDNWDGDGEAMVWVADRVMQELDGNLRLLADYDWTVWVLPCLNPDGLLDGYTEDGPGRCSTTWIDANGNLRKSRGVDLNRTFPASWLPYTDSRNFNGSEPLCAPESRALADFIRDVQGDGENLCVDAHGWYAQVITTTQSSKIYRVFADAFPGNSYAILTGSHGYFSWYAQKQGYTTCLFEFPDYGGSLARFQRSSGADRFSGCILTLAREYGTYTDRHVSITASATGGGSVSGGGVFLRDQTVALTARADGGGFLGWFDDDGSLITRNAVCVFPAQRDRVCWAVFDDEPFLDARPGDWYRDDAVAARALGLVSGTSEVIFDPDARFTRAMAVQLLTRLAGDALPASDAIPFGDVAADAWYAEAAARAYSAGLLRGVTADESFRPDEPVTRADFLTMAVRTLELLGSEETTASLPFTDRDSIPAYAYAAVGKAYGMGLLRGDPSGLLRPQDGLTRAEGVAILMRAVRYLEEKGNEGEGGR